MPFSCWSFLPFAGLAQEKTAESKPVVTDCKLFGIVAENKTLSIIITFAASQVEIAKKVSTYIQKEVYGIADFTQLESFIKYLGEKKVEIIFFLAPYHPKVFDHISSRSKYAMVLNNEGYFSKQAAAKQIKLYGSYSPAKLG